MALHILSLFVVRLQTPQELGDNGDQPIKCIAERPEWSNASLSQAHRPPRALFFDVGVEIGQSAMLVLNQPLRKACMFAWNTPNFEPPANILQQSGDTWQKVCLRQSSIAQRMLRKVQADGERQGFDLLKTSDVWMVEPSPDYAPLLQRIVAMHPLRAHALMHVAITPGDDTAGVLSSRYTMANSAGCHRKRCGKNLTRIAGALNLNRLLISHAKRDDFVVLKVDVEAREYSLLPCLVHSPAVTLVDHLLLERHDKSLDATAAARERLDVALATMIALGIHVHTGWP